MNKKPRRPCRRCGNPVKDRHTFFYSCSCSGAYRKEKLWEEFDKKGFSRNTTQKTIKDYIIFKQGYHCSLCDNEGSWKSKPLVLILDHIDGNSDNKDITNFRLVCPNCDSQLPTFKNRNIGNGRFKRKQRYQEGKSY